MTRPRRLEADEDDAPDAETGRDDNDDALCQSCYGTGENYARTSYCRDCGGSGHNRPEPDGPEGGFDDEPRDRDDDAPAGWEP